MTELTKKYKRKLKEAIKKQQNKRVITFDPDIEKEMKRVYEYNKGYDKNGWFYGHW